MSTKAAAFVAHLSQTPADLERFQSDPDAVLDEHDLSDEDRQVLKSGDAETIRQHLSEDYSWDLCVWQDVFFLKE